MDEQCTAAGQLLVESALTNYYLRSDGPFGAGAVRYIDASPPQLRIALDLENDVDPLKTLARACGGAIVMARVLARGVNGKTKSEEGPGYFRHLVLTCAVVASADANTKTQEFGENLALAFESPNWFTNRAALPQLWVRLRDWCNRRRAGGAPYRNMVLPEPGTGKYLGLTNAIAFPGWRDVARLRSLVERRSEYLRVSEPSVAAKLLCPVIENSSEFSAAMRSASTEYQQLYWAKASLLEYHRFWLALRYVLDPRRLSKQRLDAKPRLELRFGPDDNDVELQLVSTNADESFDEDGNLEGCPDDVLRSIASWLAKKALANAGKALSGAVLSGVVPLIEERFGLWVSSEAAPNLPVRCLLLVTQKRQEFARMWGVTPRAIGDEWMVTGPIPARDVPAVYQYLNYPLGDSASALYRPLRVLGGVKTGPGFLGRGAFLPQVLIRGPGVPRFESLSPGGVVPPLVAENEHTWRIDSDRSLAGQYRIRLEEDLLAGAEPLAIEKDITFFLDAIEHEQINQADETRSRKTPEFGEYNERPLAAFVFDFTQEVSLKSNISNCFDDFLEAVYAGGRAGWSEQALLTMTRQMLGTNGPSPWDVLRGLEECGWLVSTDNLGWRSRRWWLCKPSLMKSTCIDGASTALLRGSAPTAVRRRFTNTAIAAGFTVEARPGVGDCSADSILAIGGDFGKLSSELGWPILDTMQIATSLAPQCWPAEPADESRHRRASKWSWSLGRFTNDLSSPNEVVTLERFRRDRADRADLFVVTENRVGYKYVTSSRVVAVAEAYRRAKVALFDMKQDVLVRTAQDGHLPLALGFGGNLSAYRNSGPILIDGVWRYAYPTSSQLLDDLRRVLGSTFVTEVSAVDTKNDVSSRVEALATLRHRCIFRADGRASYLLRLVER